MGYAVNGKCYPDGATALKAFSESFPIATGNYMLTLQGTPIINGNDIGWTSRTVLVTSGSASTVPMITPLTACAFQADSPFEHVPMQDIAVAAGLILCFTLGMLMGNSR